MIYVYFGDELIGAAESTFSIGGDAGYGFTRHIYTPTPPVFPVPRPDWNSYFLGIADAVSKRGDCSRRQVGAVVVDKDNRIVSTGFNGSYPGGPSCLAGECPRAQSSVEPGSSYDTGPGACISTHAEANALLYAGRDGTDGSTLYVTFGPCDGCKKMIQAAGIVRVVWPQNEWWVG